MATSYGINWFKSPVSTLMSVYWVYCFHSIDGTCFLCQQHQTRWLGRLRTRRITSRPRMRKTNTVKHDLKNGANRFPFLCQPLFLMTELLESNLFRNRNLGARAAWQTVQALLSIARCCWPRQYILKLRKTPLDPVDSDAEIYYSLECIDVSPFTPDRFALNLVHGWFVLISKLMFTSSLHTWRGKHWLTKSLSWMTEGYP